MPYDRGTPYKNDKLLGELKSTLDATFPESFYAVHRVIITAAGREFAMDGYVLVKKPGSLRLLVKGSTGGAAFEAVVNPDCGAIILKNPIGLRESWILQGAIRDASEMYLHDFKCKSFLVMHKSGDIGVACDRPDGAREEYRFVGKTRRLASYILARDGTCLYRMNFSDTKSYPGWPVRVPHTTRIEDYLLNYRLTVQVIKIRVTEARDNVFRAEQ